MSWRIFPKVYSKAKYAPYIALGYGFALFIIGFHINKPLQKTNYPNPPTTLKKPTPNKTIVSNPLISESNIIKILLGILLSLSVVKIFSEMIGDEGKQQAIEYKTAIFTDKIEVIIKLLNESKIEPKVKEECLNILLSIGEEPIDKVIDKLEARKKIVVYLKNKAYLEKIVEESILNNSSIPNEYKQAFSIDIQNCLIWLRTSLEHYRSAKFKFDNLASANKNDVPLSIDIYEQVLKEIEKRLEDYSNYTGIVEDFMRQLLVYLKQESQNNK